MGGVSALRCYLLVACLAFSAGGVRVRDTTHAVVELGEAGDTQAVSDARLKLKEATAEYVELAAVVDKETGALERMVAKGHRLHANQLAAQVDVQNQNTTLTEQKSRDASFEAKLNADKVKLEKEKKAAKAAGEKVKQNTAAHAVTDGQYKAA